MIVVTAPTSTIGRQVLRRLLDAGAPVRVVARDPARLPADARERVAGIVTGSHGDPAVVKEAFTGADAVFWLAPPDPHATSAQAAYLDFTRPAAETFDKQRVVGVSALGRGAWDAGNAGLVTASLAMDELIAGTGVAYRALLLPSFMDNLLRQVESIRSQGVFTAPIPGDLKAPTCATSDIAATAAGLLLDDTWSGHDGVPVLGPEDLSFQDMARTMTEVLDRPVRFQQVSPEDYRAGLIGYGMSEPMAQAMFDMAVAKANGLDNAEPRTPQASSPTTFRQWCTTVLRPAVLTVTA